MHINSMPTQESSSRAAADRSPAGSVNLEDQFFSGPNKSPYMSMCILEPVITFEWRTIDTKELQLAVRFNLETTILSYESRTRDGHELFFHDIALQYISPLSNERLAMKPESDTSGAFAVTKNTTSQINPTANLSLSQTPSANVSLALTRSKQLTVEYKVNTWRVSSHRIFQVNDPRAGQNTLQCMNILQCLGIKRQIRKSTASLCDPWAPRHQWFWEGTQNDTKKLTPDLTYTVKRNIEVKRIVDMSSIKKSDPASKERRLQDLKDALRPHLMFYFQVQIRVKRRYGRFHRFFILSGNDVKGKFLPVTFTQNFCLWPPTKWRESFIAKFYDPSNPSSGIKMPSGDSIDLDAYLEEIKGDSKDEWDRVHGRDINSLRRVMVDIDHIKWDHHTSTERDWESQMDKAEEQPGKSALKKGPRISLLAEGPGKSSLAEGQAGKQGIIYTQGRPHGVYQ
ncbi:hypothetical protein GQ53DRAFT_216395 [Thozetella sp. PMI_491]|nr:hypothetical protein GQ53DRAFT_216395 [Thozetella sp. PMI_491]